MDLSRQEKIARQITLLSAGPCRNSHPLTTSGDHSRGKRKERTNSLGNAPLLLRGLRDLGTRRPGILQSQDLAGTITRKGQEGADSGPREEPNSVGPTTQHPGDGPPGGKVDSHLRSGRPDPPTGSKARGKGPQIQIGGEEQSPPRVELAGRTGQGRNGVHHPSPCKDRLQRIQCAKQTTPSLEGTGKYLNHEQRWGRRGYSA